VALPKFERSAAFVGVSVAIVDTGHRRQLSSDVIEQSLYDVGLYPQFGELGAEGAPQVVQTE